MFTDNKMKLIDDRSLFENKLSESKKSTCNRRVSALLGKNTVYFVTHCSAAEFTQIPQRVRSGNGRRHIIQYPPSGRFEHIQHRQLTVRSAKKFGLFDFGVLFAHGLPSVIVQRIDDFRENTLSSWRQAGKQAGERFRPSGIFQCPSATICAGAQIRGKPRTLVAGNVGRKGWQWCAFCEQPRKQHRLSIGEKLAGSNWFDMV